MHNTGGAWADSTDLLLIWWVILIILSGEFLGEPSVLYKLRMYYSSVPGLVLQLLLLVWFVMTSHLIILQD